MKLSEKGRLKIQEIRDKAWGKTERTPLYFEKTFENDLFNADFKQDDFKDAVVLTAGEALGIRMAMNPSPEDVQWRNLLERRIEQATKENEKRTS